MWRKISGEKKWYLRSRNSSLLMPRVLKFCELVFGEAGMSTRESFQTDRSCNFQQKPATITNIQKKIISWISVFEEEFINCFQGYRTFSNRPLSCNHCPTEQ